MCYLFHYLQNSVWVEKVLFHPLRRPNMLLFPMVERPVIVIKWFLPQWEHVVHLFKVKIRIPVCQELEPAYWETEYEVSPVQLSQVEPKDLLILWTDFLIQSLAAIAIKYPLASPEESKSREKGVDLLINKF